MSIFGLIEENMGLSHIHLAVSGWVFLQKTLDFRPKTYNSQIPPKYDIGRK